MNILMLGVGADQVLMIEKAKALGLKVFGMDGNKDAAGKDLCDEFICVDINDRDAVYKEAYKLNKKHSVDGAIAPAVEVGPSVGRVVDKFGLYGIGEKTADLLTNKCYRNATLQKEGFNIPEWSTSHNWDTFPCVIKPSCKCAAVGVEIVESKEELDKKQFDLVQEYIKGCEISTEVIVFSSGFYMLANADRNYDKKLSWKPALLEDGCQLPSRIPPHIKGKINTIVEKLIKVFKLSSCCIKLDLIIKDNIVYILEVAPRLGGGKLSSIMIQKTFGLDWWTLALKTCMNMPIKKEEVRPEFNEYCAQRYVFGENPKSHRDRIIDFIETGSTYEEAIENAERKVLEYGNNPIA